jgi:uncharacterized membrane protein YphA (DoxX/SURF4 family)
MNIVLWVLQILLALLFLFSGVMKFLMPYDEMVKQMPVALPHWFILFIGVCEILGGLGLVLPWLLKIRPSLTPLAAWLLVVIMIGAVVISAMGGISMAIVPFVTGLLLAFVGYGRSRGTVAS